MANDKDPNDPMEIMKKQWEAMGIDPTQMAGYMSSAMEMQKNIAQQMQNNPLTNGVQFSQEEMMNLFDDSPELKEDSDLNETEKKAIACAANIAFNNAQYLNALETEIDADTILMGLESAWGINNREELISTLDWMESTGHRSYFKIIWAAIGKLPQKDWKKAIGNLDHTSTDPDFDEERLEEFASNFVTYYPVLAGKNFFTTMKSPDVTAWDLARAINLCRLGFDVKYFTRDEALERIQRYAKMLYAIYDSWKSLSEGYLTGFAMWSGDEDEIDVRTEEHVTLLEHEKSLWTRIKW